MNFKVRRCLGLWWCIPAVLFLFEPVIGFRDVLPNWIGYLILYLCLGQASDLCGRLEESRAGFFKMIWFGLGAWVMEYYLFVIVPSTEAKLNIYETPTWILLCSFVMLVLQCIFLLPACRKLFLGLGDLAERHGGNVLKKTHVKKRTRYERAADASCVFVIASSVLSVLPEISLLTSFEYESERVRFDWYEFIGLFRTVAGFAAAIFGLVWLIRVIITIAGTLSDRPLMEAVEARYAEEMLPKTGVLMLRRVRLSFALMMLGMIFTATARMDFRMLLPSAFCAVLFCVAIALLWKIVKRRMLLLVSAGALLLTSGAQRVLCERFLRMYSVFEMSMYKTDAYLDFFVLRLVEIADAMAVFVLMWAVLRMLLQMISDETAEMYDNDTGEVSLRATDRLHRRFGTRIAISAALSFLAALAKALESYFQLQYPWLWWIAIAMTVVSALFFITLLHAVTDQLAWQYSTYDLHKMPSDGAYLHCNPNLQKGVQQNAEQSEQQSKQQSKQQSE